MLIEPGVYEKLISNAIEKKLASIESSHYIKKEKLDSADSHLRLARYLGNVVASILESIRKEEGNEAETITSQVDVVNKILKFIETGLGLQIETSEDQLSEESKLSFLRGIYSKIGLTEKQVEAKAQNHPISGYSASSLFTGGNDSVSLDSEVCKDIRTADQIDFVVSFIKFEGLRLLLKDLEDFDKIIYGRNRPQSNPKTF